ncbi:MAG: hypothetical protein EXR38_02330 [Methylotenera sp.]|nr:hypothetical protein [Methylotenera sp.]
MLAGLMSLSLPISAFADTLDAGQILRDTKPANPLSPARPLDQNLIQEQEKPIVAPSPSDDVSVTISHFTFTGNVCRPLFDYVAGFYHVQL